jgi:hypothetical protein
VRSGDADDGGALGGLDDVVGDGVQLVDLQNAFEAARQYPRDRLATPSDHRTPPPITEVHTRR